MTDRAPYLTLAAAGLRHDDLRGDVRARPAHRRGQPRPGLPGHRRPARDRRSRDRGDPRRPQPVPARASASPSCATRSREHQRHWYGLDFDPDTEVLVTAGATEAIAASLLALCEAGDEVVTFEPYYDSYAACTSMAGAQRKVVTLQPPDYHFDAGRAPRPRSRRGPGCCCSTRPTTRPARSSRAPSWRSSPTSAVEHDLIAVTDEVYEHLVFEGEHVPLATLPGHARPHRHDLVGRQDVLVHRLEDRLGVRIAAAASTAVKTAKQFLTYVNGAPFQHAIATALALPDDHDRRARRRISAGAATSSAPGSRRAGFTVFRPGGHLLRDDRHPRARRGRRHGVLPGAARALRRRRGAERRVLRRRGRGPLARPVHVLQAPRGARRGDPAPATLRS